EKRILLAFLLSIVVMTGFQLLTGRKSSPGTQSTASTAPASAPAAPVEPAKSAVSTPTAAESGTNEDIHAEQAEDLTVETALYTATVSNHGAVLKSFKLKKFTDTKGNPVELIDATGAAKNGWPLATTTPDPKLDEVLAGANYVTHREGNRVAMEFASNGTHV